MKRTLLFATMALGLSSILVAQPRYQVLKVVAAGGEGGYDYVYADQAGRKLYVPRLGDQGRITVFDLDTLAPAGEIDGFSAHGVAVSPRSGHGYATSNPVVMWDASSLQVLKTIPMEGHPDGVLYEPLGDEIWVFSHQAPNLTVIRALDGAVVGTFDLGGAPEQAVSDGKGLVYVDIEDKNEVALVDSATKRVIRRYPLGGLAEECAGLALDPQNRLLFVACRKPAALVILDSDRGTVKGSLPIGTGCDGTSFNPVSGEVFTSQGDGTLTVVRVKGPDNFVVEQTVKTLPNARTSTLDLKTGKLFLIAAAFGPPQPNAAPGFTSKRGPMVPDSFKILEIGE